MAPNGQWSVEWARWYDQNDAFEGVEPPAEIKRIYELLEMRGAVPAGSDEDTALYEEIVQIYKDNLWLILPVQRWDTLIVNADLMNVASGSEKSIGANTAGELWWYDR